MWNAEADKFETILADPRSLSPITQAQHAGTGMSDEGGILYTAMSASMIITYTTQTRSARTHTHTACALSHVHTLHDSTRAHYLSPRSRTIRCSTTGTPSTACTLRRRRSL